MCIRDSPYVLISILSALHEGEFTLSEVQGTLEMLFEKQYILTEEVVVETRYPVSYTHLTAVLRRVVSALQYLQISI